MKGKEKKIEFMVFFIENWLPNKKNKKFICYHFFGKIMNKKSLNLKCFLML